MSPGRDRGPLQRDGPVVDDGGMRRLLLPCAVLLATLLTAPVASAAARPDVAQWPSNDKMVLIQNDKDQERTLDGRTGHSPFDDTAPAGDCNKRCESYLVPCDGVLCQAGGRMWDARRRYLKLLGGHGSDTIYGSPFTDVLWGDFKGSGQPESQRDTIDGGAGRDFIYTSHGDDDVLGGTGDDYIVARFSRGTIDCGPGRDIVFVSKKSRAATKFKSCETITRGDLR